jgi:hypothetical protein
MATPTHKKRGFSLIGSFPDMRDWGSGPGLGGWGAEGVPGASAQRPDYTKDRELLDVISERIHGVQELDVFDVEVRADDGVITLTGSVPLLAMRTLIEQVVEQTEGVKRVVNELIVRPRDPDAMGSE